jgi:uncharacterized protein (TIGR02996 family)
MPTEEEGLLQSILAAPDDDGVRLVYADWLDEHGQPERAEFIRAQVALESEPELSPRWRELYARSEKLLKGRVTKWCPPLENLGAQPAYRRGFVESVVTSTRLFVRRAADLFAKVPLRWLRLGSTAEGVSLADALRSPALARMYGLTVDFPLEGDDPRALAESPHAANLRVLEVGLPGYAGSDPSPLFHSDSPGALHTLTVRGQGAGRDRLTGMFQALAGSPLARRLARLRVLPDTASALPGLRALIESPNLTNLRTLELMVWLPGGGPLAYALADSDLLGRLHHLSLARVDIGDGGVVRLAASPRAAGLRVLDLRGSLMTDSGARALLESPYLEKVWWLGVTDRYASGDVYITKDVLGALRRRFGPGVGKEFKTVNPDLVRRRI